MDRLSPQPILGEAQDVFGQMAKQPRPLQTKEQALRRTLRKRVTDLWQLEERAYDDGWAQQSLDEIAARIEELEHVLYEMGAVQLPRSGNWAQEP